MSYLTNSWVSGTYENNDVRSTSLTGHARYGNVEGLRVLVGDVGERLPFVAAFCDSVAGKLVADHDAGLKQTRHVIF